MSQSLRDAMDAHCLKLATEKFGDDGISPEKLHYADGFYACLTLLWPSVTALEYLENDEQPLIAKTLKELKKKVSNGE